MKKLLNEYKVLLRSIPSLIVALFIVAVVSSNILANKTIVSIGNWFALDGGIVVSWLIFLCMDMVTRRFGPKAATRLTIVASVVNLLVCGLFFIVSVIPSNADDYTALNQLLGGTWFILMDSTIAFIVSGVINNFSNAGIGKLFKNNPDGKLAYISRAYISTFIGQFIDNLIFATLTFMVFSPIFWDGFSWTFLQCVTCSLTGAIVELLMEVVFSPIGYKVCAKWKEEGVGQGYLDLVK